MKWVDASNAADYLRAAGHIPPDEGVIVRELAGGVSNVVLLVERPFPAESFVIKQVREQLRVPDPWFCSIDRIWREVDTLQVCRAALDESALDESAPDESAPDESAPDESPGGSQDGLTIAVPEVRFVDRENYLYAMTAAPPHDVWKTLLLRGEVRDDTAAACGRLLGILHARTWLRPDVTAPLADRAFFDALRLDPYYRHVARHRPELAPQLDGLIDSLGAHPRCLVHGDFSPKNILVHPGGLTLVDFEVGHLGDPAFDLGFFLAHLVLKAMRAEGDWWRYVRLTFSFWRAYAVEMARVCEGAEWSELVVRGIANFAGCLLARVAGKSRVDYLNPAQQERAATFAADLLRHPAREWSSVIARFVQQP